MGIDRQGFRVRSSSYGPAKEALSREGLDQLVDDAINDLKVLRREITPDNIREYVEDNVRINVDIGRHLEPSATDMEEALEWSRIEARCAASIGAGLDASDAEPSAAFRP